jgi:hypothetical protein
MRRRHIVLLAGLLTLAACLDRKTGSSGDGAVFDDAFPGEVAPPSSGDGSSVIDGSATTDTRQPIDGAGTQDVPITTPDAKRGDVGTAGTGGISDSGGISVGTGGAGTGGGGINAGAGGAAGAGDFNSVCTTAECSTLNMNTICDPLVPYYCPETCRLTATGFWSCLPYP